MIDSEFWYWFRTLAYTLIKNVVMRLPLNIHSIFSSRISGQGHRIRAVCVSVSTLTAEPFDLQQEVYPQVRSGCRPWTRFSLPSQQSIPHMGKGQCLPCCLTKNFLDCMMAAIKISFLAIKDICLLWLTWTINHKIWAVIHIKWQSVSLQHRPHSRRQYIFIDREAGEIIRLVASICLSVCLSVCVFVCPSSPV